MRKNTSYYSDFLFVKHSFIILYGSVLNIAGNYFSFNHAASGAEADTKAIQSDWGVIGNDIENASDEILKSSNHTPFR